MVPILFDPLNGILKTNGERVFLLPLGETGQLFIGAKKPCYLTLFRSEPLVLAEDSGFRIDLVYEFLCQIPDGNFFAASYVYLFSNGFG